MPLYEYLCRECDHEVELLVRSGEEPSCPDCEGGQLVRLLSVPSAHQLGEKAAPDRPDGPCGSACGCFPGG